MFGRVLNVSMKDHDNVIPVLDGVTQAFFLVAAVAEVARIPVHVEIRDVVQQLVSHPGPEGVVAARVIDDVDLRGLLFEWGRYPLVRRNECAHRFIGHNKNADAFHVSFCYGAWRGGSGALESAPSKSASNCAFPCSTDTRPPADNPFVHAAQNGLP